MKIRFLPVIFFLTLALATFAGIPPGYYDGTEGLCDSVLLSKLRQSTGNGLIFLTVRVQC